MKFFLFIAIIILIVFGVIQFNNSSVEVTMKFLKWEASKPLVIIIAIPYIAGIISSMLLFVPPWVKKASQARHHKKRIQELELELANANEPIDSDELVKEGPNSNKEENQT